MNDQSARPIGLQSVVKVDSIPREHMAALILAAGGSPGGSTEFASALTVVAGRPVIQWTLDYMMEMGLLEIHIAVDCDDSVLRDFIAMRYQGCMNDLHIHQMFTSGPGETLSRLLAKTSATEGLVILGDTFVDFGENSRLGKGKSIVWTQDASDSRRWCSFDVDDRGNIVKVFDKVPGRKGPLQAAVGAYYFPSLENVRSAINFAHAKGRITDELAPILTELMNFEDLGTESPSAWIDAGHLDMKWSSSKILLESRSFNTLQVDTTLGTVTKRSLNSEKLIHEINYLRLLPTPLSVLFPRLVDFSVDQRDSWVTQELYAYPTLSELFLFHELDDSVWVRVFRRLHHLIAVEFDSFHTYVSAESVILMYLGKLQQRTKTLMDEGEGLGIVMSASEIHLNGEPLKNLSVLETQIQEAIGVLAGSVNGRVIHGDLCFSNILYELAADMPRLIDPRGSFGDVGVGGDPRYDVAKLWHSVDGGYDFLASGFFDLRCDGENFELLIPWRPQHERLKRDFQRRFSDGFSFHEIKLIAGLMMCSLPALHSESKSRQVALYLQGLRLINEGIEEWK